MSEVYSWHIRLFGTRSHIVFVLFGMLVFLTRFNYCVSQTPILKIRKTADQYFKEENFSQALNYYIRFNEYKSGEPEVLQRIAICQYYTNQLEEAADNFIVLINSGFYDTDATTYYYYARTKHLLYNFEEAAQAYKMCLRYGTGQDINLDKIVHAIKQCKTGKDLIHRQHLGYIQNPGPKVNSDGDDIQPIFDPSQPDQIYFSSNQDRFEIQPVQVDASFRVFNSSLVDGEWELPEKLHISTDAGSDEFPIILTQDGNTLIYQTGSFQNASLHPFPLNEEIKPNPNDAIIPFFPEYGDRGLFRFADSILLFSSLRPGGYGGYDIYFSIKRDGQWLPPENLGADINSPYSEVDPILSRDGRSIYFSSDRTTSMGGFDVFRSQIKPGQIWSTPVNLGCPINSSRDDVGFQLSAKGTSALLYSDRPEGYGGFDIYLAYSAKPLDKLMPQYPFTVPDFIGQSLEEIVAARNDSMRLVFIADSIRAVEVKDSLIQISLLQELQYEAPNPPPPPVVDENIYPRLFVNIDPLYFGKDEEVLNPQTIRSLDKIAGLLKKYPKLKVLLISHSSDYSGPSYFDLYFSIKRAESIVNHLNKLAIPTNRISIYAAGQQFPYASDAINHDLAGYSSALNRRIDINILNGEQYNLTFNYRDGGLENDQIDPRNELLNKLMDGLSFKVQIKSVSQVYKNERLSKYSLPMAECHEDSGIYYYTVGWTKSFYEINKIKGRLQKRYEEAEIIPYFNGHRMSESQINSLVEYYPELKKHQNNQP